MTLATRSYSVLFVGFTAAILGFIAAVNFVVDPYGLWRPVEIRGFNAAKSERRNQAHLFKSFDLRAPLPSVLIVGSSRTAYGIDPTHSNLEAAGGAYNAAIPGGHLKVIHRYLELAVAANPDRIRTVIFGLDFFEFNQSVYESLPNTYSENRLRLDSLSKEDLLNALLTLDSTWASAATVFSNAKDPDYQPYYTNGQLTAIDMRRSVEARGIARRFSMSLNSYLNKPHRLRDFRLSEEAFVEFAQIVDLCREHEIELVTFVAPTHAAHMEAIFARELWDEFEHWKQRIVSITPFWDFSGYNTVTTEPLNDSMSNFWDISHYRSHVGDLILERILDGQTGATRSEFGVWVTTENIDLALRRATEGRDGWLRSNTELTQLIGQTIEHDP